MSSLSHDESSGDELVEVEVEDSVLKKGPWTSEEDEILAAYVTKHGVGNWNAVRKNTGLARCGKSCRLRWSNHLRPDLKKGAFSAEEQRKIIELHALMGNKWARMALELPGRTDNEIKNFWNTRQKKRKRAGLPLYPDDIKPALLNSDNQEDSLNGSTQQQAYDSQPDTSVPELIFNSYKLSQKHPLYIPPIPDKTEHKTFDFEQGSDNPIVQTPKLLHDSDMPPALFDCMFQGDYMSGGYACSSDPLTITELPPFPPSFDDETLIEINPLIEHTQYYEPVAPRSSELLDSMFYPPKILEGSHHFSNHPFETQRVPNPEKKENFNMHGDPTNPNDLPEFRWFENYDKDQSAIQDTLFSVIQPYVNRKTSS